MEGELFSMRFQRKPVQNSNSRMEVKKAHKQTRRGSSIHMYCRTGTTLVLGHWCRFGGNLTGKDSCRLWPREGGRDLQICQVSIGNRKTLREMEVERTHNCFHVLNDIFGRWEGNRYIQGGPGVEEWIRKLLPQVVYHKEVAWTGARPHNESDYRFARNQETHGGLVMGGSVEGIDVAPTFVVWETGHMMRSVNWERMRIERGDVWNVHETDTWVELASGQV